MGNHGKLQRLMCRKLTICKLDVGLATDRTTTDGAIKADELANRHTSATIVERALVNMFAKEIRVEAVRLRDPLLR